MKRRVVNGLAWLGLVAGFAGCGGRSTEGTWVLTQVPVREPTAQARTWLDLAYPAGSRVVTVGAEGRGKVHVLSGGLAAAGDPRLSPDGTRVLFCGRAEGGEDWQVYEVAVRGGRARQLTHVPGGAMTPAWLPDNRFVFSSPVPGVAPTGESVRPAAVYAQSFADGRVERLSFGVAPATDLTVLQDGRILFVSAAGGEAPAGAEGLFTINNDGTEVTAFAAVHDGAVGLQRPRELPDGRLVFLSGSGPRGRTVEAVEQVSMARPFSSRRPLAIGRPGSVRSVEQGRDGELLVAFHPPSGATAGSSFGIYGLGPEGLRESAVFDDPAWHDVEASRCGGGLAPMGRLSTLDTNTVYGRVLCLNANEGTDVPEGGADRAAAFVRVRLGGATGEGPVMGEIPVHEDGSFLAELPADVPLGLETVDREGRVIRRLAPAFWLRPGENRACVGCHEPHNRSPRNRRPLAVRHPAVQIGQPGPTSLTRVP